MNNKKIFRIDCDYSNSPAFYKTKIGNKVFESLIVRTGTENTVLESTQEIIEYILRKYKPIVQDKQQT